MPIRSILVKRIKHVLVYLNKVAAMEHEPTNFISVIGLAVYLLDTWCKDQEAFYR